MRKLFITLALVLGLAAQAQPEDENRSFNHLSVGVNLGTNGLGLEVGAPITSFLFLRAGADFVPVFNVKANVHFDRPSALENVPISFLKERYVYIPKEGQDLDINVRPFLTQAKILVDIYPFKASPFFLTLGATIGSSSIAKARVVDRTIAAVELYNQDIRDNIIKPEPGYENGINIDFGGYHLTPDMGRCRIDFKANAIRPYFGFGFGRTIPRKRLGFKFDAGVQYWGPIKMIDYYGDNGQGHVITGDEEGIKADASIRDNVKLLNNFCVYPTIKFSLFGRIF